MVAMVRRGGAIRAVAAQYKVAPSTVLFWSQRAGQDRLDRVDWADRRSGPRRPANKSSRELEDLVLSVRQQLKDCSDLGEFGALAIHRALSASGVASVPAVRTIARILERRGALDGRRRMRRPAPPRAWYLPDVAASHVELDSFDTIQGLVIQGGIDVEVLTGLSLHAGWPMAWPHGAITAAAVVEALSGHWREVGLPAYAQFDNATCFQGPHQHPDTIGRVSRLCLSLGVVPVFVPPLECGFQAAIENFNGRWQAKVWARFHHTSLDALQRQSSKFIAASRWQSAARLENAPARRAFPQPWTLDLTARPHGRLIFLRRTNEHGTVSLLGHRFPLDAQWPHRLVRAEVDLDAHLLRFYALRRQEPAWQPLLREVPYELPHRPFKY